MRVLCQVSALSCKSCIPVGQSRLYSCEVSTFDSCMLWWKAAPASSSPLHAFNRVGISCKRRVHWMSMGYQHAHYSTLVRVLARCVTHRTPIILARIPNPAAMALQQFADEPPGLTSTVVKTPAHVLGSLCQRVDESIAKQMSAIGGLPRRSVWQLHDSCRGTCPHAGSQACDATRNTAVYRVLLRHSSFDMAAST